MNQNERIEGFAHEIFKNADALVKKIEVKTARATKEQLDMFAEKAKAEFDTRSAYETNRLRTGSNREIARLNAEVRRAAVQRREQIVAEVFSRAAERLTAYCETPDYLSALASCIEELTKHLGDGATVFVCARDEAAAKQICASMPNVSEVCVSEKIKIGLAGGCNAEKTIYLEDTFDSRLAAQKDRFLQESGLVLEA